jgi:hypothetical protein
VTRQELQTECAKLCPRCASGDPLRRRTDSLEFVHDWNFGMADSKTGRKSGFGHGICQAHALRTEWEGKLSD